MKAVILAGGRGERLGRLTANNPKPMVKVGPWPLLEHQIRLLARFGIKDIVILGGFQAGKIQSYFKDGKKWGVKITYLNTPVEFNTVDRVAAASKILKQDFLLFYGDVMANFNVKKLVNFHRVKGGAATLAVHPNNHPYDSDLVEPNEHARVVKFHSKPHPKGANFRNLVNAGVYVLSPKLFALMKKHKGADFGKTLFPAALKNGYKLFAYGSAEYFKDMGTPERLKAVIKDFKQGIIARATQKRPAVFLDRDGVINKEVDQLRNIKDLSVYAFVPKAIAKLNAAGLLCVVATNQPQIARGYITEEYLRKIHNKLETILGEKRAYLDAIYYCPHHPLDATVLHPVKKYTVACTCRKPKIGMFKMAAKALNIDLKNSWFVGDTTRDAKTAEKAKIKFIGVKTGYGMKDKKHTLKKNYPLVVNLSAAVDLILKH